MKGKAKANDPYALAFFVRDAEMKNEEFVTAVFNVRIYL